MKRSIYFKKVLNVVLIELGAFFIILSLFVVLTSNEDIKKNFKIYETKSIEKKVFGVTDNSSYAGEQLLTPILSCRFPDPTLNDIDLNDLEILLNKKVRLLENYRPDDLIELSTLGINSQGTVLLRKEAADALYLMNEDMKNEKISIRVNSGWRDFNSQQDAYIYWEKAMGNNASLYAAPVGGSEHHLGVAIDIVSAENNYKLLPSFTNTKLHKFLIEKAYQYGFINSYPKDKESITGFTYEPWHYRYVGIKVASEIRSLNISLTEYLYKLNNYCLITY